MKDNKFVEKVVQQFEDCIYSTESKASLKSLIHDILKDYRHDYWLNWYDVREMLLKAREEARKEVDENGDRKS